MYRLYNIIGFNADNICNIKSCLLCSEPGPELVSASFVIPSWYQEKLKLESLEAANFSNRQLNEVFDMKLNEVLYVQLSIAPSELDQIKDKETYLSRTSDEICNWTNLGIENIFDPLPGSNDKARRIVFLAIAGMGKTTATQARASNWGMSKAKSSTQALYRFECRTFQKLVKDRIKLSLEQLIFDHHGPQVDSPEERSKIMWALNSPHTEIIIDGLDELDDLEEMFVTGYKVTDVHQKTTIPNLFFNLKNGNLLRSARFLFSTRPNSKINLRDFERVVLGLGFTNDSIRKCIEILCQRDQSKIDPILAHLEKTNLKVHCYVPLTCVLITMVLLNDLKGNNLDKKEASLNTFTHLYIRVIKQLLWKSQGQERLGEYNPREEHLKGLKRLAALAADGLLTEHRKVVFDKEDIKAHQITESDISIGLLEVTSEQETILNQGHGTRTVSSFLHLSLQEFMTAVYLVRKWNPKSLKFIRKNLNSSRFDMVLLFAAGLLGDTEAGHPFLAALDSSLTSSVLQKRTKELISMLTSSSIGEDRSTGKSSQLQQLLCLSEGKLGPLLEDGLPKSTLDLSNLVGGMLPYQIVAVGYHMTEFTQLTCLKFVINIILICSINYHFPLVYKSTLRTSSLY